MTSLKEQSELLRACFSDLCGCLTATIPGPPPVDGALDPDRVSEACEIVAELQADLWDLDPTLIEPLAAPRFSRDLSKMIHTLETNLHPLVRGQTWAGLYDYLPATEVDRLQRAQSERVRLDLVRAWWSAHAAGFEPLEKIERQLREPRRWRRVHAARHLRELGGPDLIDPSTSDIDEAAFERWCRSRRGPTLVR